MGANGGSGNAHIPEIDTNSLGRRPPRVGSGTLLIRENQMSVKIMWRVAAETMPTKEKTEHHRTAPVSEHDRAIFAGVADRGSRTRSAGRLKRVFLVASFFVIWMAMSGVAMAQICTSYLASLPKESRLFLYFPAANDATFPTNTLGNISGVNSQPIAAFTAANLDSDLTATTATTTQLRNRITEQVRDSYCEFSVEVIQSTTEPAPTGTAWQVVGVGADTEPGNRFGRAQDIDTGDSDLEDYARVWATEFHDAYGTAGGINGDALAPANATIERWSTAIAGTVAHEAGHNYGLLHGSSAPRSGTSEDQQNNHFLATGSTGLTDEQRVTRRHFSDTSFEALAHNLGLNTKTLSNWDFSNPNDSNATGLEIRLLSTASTLSLTRVYNGSLSPWTNPSLTKQTGTQSFRGTTYNIFDLVFTTGKTWSNGSSGIVPAGVKFHVGAGVDADAVVYDVTLTDSGGDMDLHPRMFGYGFGLADDTDDAPAGTGFIRFFAAEDDENALLIEDVVVRFLPQPVSLAQMVEGGELIAENGQSVEPFSRRGLIRDEHQGITDRVRQDEVGTVLTLPIAHLTDRRHLDLTIEPTAVCDEDNRTRPLANTGPSDRVGPGEEDYCDAGDYLSLFPATNVYVTATVVDPNARFFDPIAGTFVNGRLESKLFAQFAGVIPDFNENGRDDYLDIRDGDATDANGDGIPDRAATAWSIYGGLGVTLPSPAELDPGISGTLRIERHFGNQTSIGLGLGYHGFDIAAEPVDPEAVEVSLRGTRSVSPTPRLQLFVGGGAGVYFFDHPGDTEFGLHVGVGVRYRIRPRFDLEVNADYHEITNSSADFGTVHGGLRFRF